MPLSVTRYARLKADAIFVIRVGHAWCLPKGTIISLLPNATSPVTGNDHELHVQAPDAGSRPWRGWIARATPLEPVPARVGEATKVEWSPVRVMTVSPLDQLRELVTLTVPRDGWDKRERPVKPWTMSEWLCAFGKTHRAKLEAVCKQFRLTIPKNDDQLIRKVVKITTNEEVSMSRVEKTRRQARRDAAHRKAMAQEVVVARKERAGKDRRKAERRQSRVPETIGTALLALKINALAKPARRLADGKATHKDLVQLRNLLNTTADALREKGKNKLASAVSAQNRLVRRLERAGR